MCNLKFKSWTDSKIGGITQIEFSPDGTKLFAGGRKDDEILIWDMRNPGMLYAVLNREVNTNQRIYFDIESSGRYVFSGNTDGSVSVWDLDQSVETTGQNGQLDTVSYNKLDTVGHFQKYIVIRSCHFQSILCPWMRSTNYLFARVIEIINQARV